MGKSVVIFICLFSLLGLTQASDEKPEFIVEGRVYCDPCRSLIKHNLTKPMAGGPIFIKCKNRETRHITFMRMDTANADGVYRVPVEGDHKNDICKIELQFGDDEECKENPCEVDHTQTFEISLTHNNNTNGNVRKVNDFFYYPKKAAIKECTREFKNMKHMPQVQDIQCALLTDM